MRGTSIRLLAGIAVVALVLTACSSDSKKADKKPAGSTTSTTKKAKGPAVTVTPATGLTDGQVVHVTGTGFVVGHQVAINECSDDTDDTGSGCDLGGLKLLTVDANGAVAGDFPVKVGPFGKDNVVCKAKGPKSCLLSIGELTGDAPHPTADIAFAA
ncbi:MAG: neocarzinostatin apoprotein domain-containing protein [Acidimicrobiia bacterium]